MATRKRNARSAGAFFRPREFNKLCDSINREYCRLQTAHVLRCPLTACISRPVTAPSRYGENNILAWAQFMKSPQALRRRSTDDQVGFRAGWARATQVVVLLAGCIPLNAASAPRVRAAGGILRFPTSLQ